MDGFCFVTLEYMSAFDVLHSYSALLEMETAKFQNLFAPVCSHLRSLKTVKILIISSPDPLQLLFFTWTLLGGNPQQGTGRENKKNLKDQQAPFLIALHL